MCIWVKKNLTVSTDPNFLKDQFNLEYERANKVADIAKSKPYHMAIACSDSEIAVLFYMRLHLKV